MAVRSPIVNTCCGCITRRTGALTFAYLSLIWYILQMIAGFCILGIGIKDHLDSFQYTNAWLGSLLITSSLAFILPSTVLGLIFTGMLLNGIHKLNAYFMIPWIVMQVFACSVNFTSMVAASIYWAPPPTSVIGLAVALPVLVVILGIQIYSILVVFSHFQDIKNSDIPPVDYHNLLPTQKPQPNYPRLAVVPRVDPNQHYPNLYPMIEDIPRRGSHSFGQGFNPGRPAPNNLHDRGAPRY